MTNAGKSEEQGIEAWTTPERAETLWLQWTAPSRTNVPERYTPELLNGGRDGHRNLAYKALVENLKQKGIAHRLHDTKLLHASALQYRPSFTDTCCSE